MEPLAKSSINVANQIDPNCILNINKRLVRVQYPGNVNNVDKAVKTLGGISNIELNVVERARRLDLRFHRQNKFNKRCFADKDFKPGILIRVKKPTSNENEKVDYEVLGVTAINFIFNRLCDFQYLPYVKPQPESKSKFEYIYEKIVLKELPNTDYDTLINQEELKTMEPFLIPGNFSQYDSAKAKLNVDTEQVKTDSKSTKQSKSICKIFGKNRQKISIFVNFTDDEIPTKPLDAAVKLSEHRIMPDIMKRVKQLFEERPIWTKAAILYNAGITNEQVKIVLPAVAYHFFNGPWRISWVKFGFDPRKDPTARIYQTLDYRIKSVEGSKLKISAKRTCKSKKCTTNFTNKVTLKDDISEKRFNDLDERCYVLRPFTIPPARQMFYQLSDLLLPEIQEMISTLPKTTNMLQCHLKYGWLNEQFLSKCRKIVNKNILNNVREQVLDESRAKDIKIKKANVAQTSTSMEYCNQMLNNVKKGIYTNLNSSSSQHMDDDLSFILSSDDEFDEIIQNRIPERMEALEDQEDNEESILYENEEDDEAEIDFEVAEEIKQMLSQANN